MAPVKLIVSKRDNFIHTELLAKLPVNIKPEREHNLCNGLVKPDFEIKLVTVYEIFAWYVR